MSWRNHEDHKAETKAVKKALTAAGIAVARVGHGRGTSWGWLKVRLMALNEKHAVHRIGGSAIEYKTREEMGREFVYWQCIGGCEGCTAVRNREHTARLIIREVTGRRGDYDGNVNLYS